MHDPDMLLCKAFDNRVGCGLVIQTLQEADQQRPNTLIGVGAVQEEVGCRGAITATNAVRPDVAIIMEGTPADDGPGSPRDEAQGMIGDGPQIRIMDPTAIMNRPLVNWIKDLAEANSIPLQIAVRTSGGTDAKSVHLSQLGVPTVVIGVPARYIHTHCSMIHLDDYLATLKLTTLIANNLDQAIVDSFTDF